MDATKTYHQSVLWGYGSQCVGCANLFHFRSASVWDEGSL